MTSNQVDQFKYIEQLDKLEFIARKLIKKGDVVMLIFIEGIVVCFILLLVCTLVLKDGPEKCAVFHEEDVKKRVVELGYITEKELKKRYALSGIGLFVPMLILVPVMVYCINGASDFWSAFWQMTAIFMIGNIFDRLFIDEFWVGHTKAWFIPGTEDLMPYIPVKVKIKKWVGNLIMFPLLSAIIAEAVTFFTK